MEVKRSFLQVYATIVSIVAIITFLIAVGSIVSAIIDRANPMYAGRNEINLSSFEQFKLETMRSVTKDQVYIPTDKDLMNMYEAAKNEKVKLVNHQSRKTLIVNSLLLFVAITLFITHWKMLRT